jgi:hypothetical protein
MSFSAWLSFLEYQFVVDTAVADAYFVVRVESQQSGVE